MIPTVGTAIYDTRVYSANSNGWIAEVSEIDKDTNIYSLSHGLHRQTHEVTVVYEGGDFVKMHLDDVKRFIQTAEQYNVPNITEDEAANRLADAQQKRRDAQLRQQRERIEREEALAAFHDSIRDKIPADAKAVLIAEMEIDDCDSMSDYFNVKTGRTIILGFSAHTRNNFKEMRKAALNNEETAFLAGADSDAEHRENYSMGAGYYLKDGHRYSTGWAIKKRTLSLHGNDIAKSIPYGEWSVPAASQPEQSSQPKTGEAEAKPFENVGGVQITERTHTKKGFQMFLCELPERVDSTAFQSLLREAKQLKGWYSRKWKDSPAGFAFKDNDAALKFAAIASERFENN